MSTITLTRRALLKGSVAVGAGLVVGFRLPQKALAQQSGVFAPNQRLRIDKDGLVTIVNSVPEMGQGTSTSMPMIVADELDVDLSKVQVEQAPANPKLYANPVTGSQSYGGSRGIRDHIAMWRKAGAAAREMLKQAAANEWGVPLGEVDTEPGAIVHRPSGRRLSYGQLVDKAQQLPVPQNPPLKTPDRFRYIGKEFARLDVPQKIDGRAVYGIDVKMPGMLYASIERPPVVAGAKVKSFDATAAKQVKGVKNVVQVTHGLAVVATSSWAALKGRRALKVEWDEGPLATLTSAQITREYETLVREPGREARKVGDAEQALGTGGRTLETIHQVPFLEHACMEPMNSTAHVTADACTVWAPTQNPGNAQATAARLTGLPPEKVAVQTTLLGGGFGRRGEVDYVIDAVEVAKAVGAPVKVFWTREDDIRHSFYRPATYNHFRAAFAADGTPVAWWHRIVGPGLQSQRGRIRPGTVDPTAVAAAADIPYDIPNIRVEWKEKDFGVPVGFWRSVGSSQNAFIVESFIAVAFSYGSYAAHVAEVSVNPDGRVEVHRVVCAIDCGFAVNPDQVKAQMEGGVIYALTALLYGEITIENGRVKQSNFHDYPMLRIDEAPVVEVHILDSGEAPGGLGEPGVPTVAPAITNAIFALTGKRLRQLPIRPDDLRRA